MAQSITALKRTIQGTRDLHTVVRTMKTMAAVNMNKMEAALQSMERYFSTIETALGSVFYGEQGESFKARIVEQLSNKKSQSARNKSSVRGFIVFGSHQGLAGSFNEVVARKTLDEIHGKQPMVDYIILCIGSRAANAFKAHGIPVKETLEGTGDLAEASSFVLEILDRMGNWSEELNVEKASIIYNHTRKGTEMVPVTQTVLPLETIFVERAAHYKPETRQLPLLVQSREDLFERLSRDYLFNELYKGFVESIACENAVRLASMEAAQNNIEDRLDELNGTYNNLRQSKITEELLDITAGTMALESE